MMAGKVRYGILGFGSFAERSIAPAFRETTQSTLVALQKRDRAAAEQAAGRWSCRAYTGVADLIRDAEVDAIFSAGVNSERCRETLLAAEAGKHALIEKPMAMNAGECRRMIDACRAHGVKLMVAQVVRFSPAVRKIKEIVASGRLGRVIAVRSEFVFPGRQSPRAWLTDRRLAGGGPVYDVGVHCIDTIRYVLGQPVVLAGSALHPTPTADRTESTAVLALQCGDSVPAAVVVSFESGFRRTVLEIVGTEGILTCFDFTRGQWSPRISITASDDRAPVDEIVVPVGDIYAAEIDHFSGCILNDTTPLVPGEEGLENQLILDASMRGAS